MDFKQKMSILENLMVAIKNLNLSEVLDVCKMSDYFAVHMNSIACLPEGKIEYRVRHEEKVCNYPWEAVVTKDGIEYYALVSFDDAWALYV